MTIRVLIADDHAMMRDGLRSLLGASTGISVVGEVDNGREALQRAQDLAPDVVVMDIAMPDLNGIEAAAMIRARRPGARIVILSMHSSTEHVYRAFAAGAAGYVLKASASAEVISAVRTVHAGQRYLSPALHDSCADILQGAAHASPLDSLSPREREVLQLVVEGKSSAAIAAVVHLSPKSVETYRSRLMKKLGVGDLPALVKFALEHGITPGA
jgi:DNA-binding NarL/FixJ family response regulator